MCLGADYEKETLSIFLPKLFNPLNISKKSGHLFSQEVMPIFFCCYDNRTGTGYIIFLKVFLIFRRLGSPKAWCWQLVKASLQHGDRHPVVYPASVYLFLFSKATESAWSHTLLTSSGLDYLPKAPPPTP